MNSRTTFIAAKVIITVCFACAVFGDDPSGTSRRDIAAELNEIARIAGVMMDGDLCEKIMTERALNFLFTVDPRDPWAASDNFDVNHEAYIQAKKTLIRLSRLVPFPCDVNLWMPLKGKPGKIQVLIRNVNEWSQFWTWGMLTQDTPPEMDRVLRAGKRETVRLKPGMVSVLAPVTNSLGDIVGLVEVVAYQPDFAAPQVHASAAEDVELTIEPESRYWGPRITRIHADSRGSIRAIRVNLRYPRSPVTRLWLNCASEPL